MKYILFMLALTIAVATMGQTKKPTTKPATTQVRTTKTQATKTPTKTAAMTPQQRAAAQKAAEQKRAAMQKQYEAQFKEVPFTIVGKAHGFEPNEIVKLCYAGDEIQAFDSVQLNGEDFTFSGKCLGIPREVFIVLGQGINKTLVELFLEQGTINVDITAGERIDKVTGTTNNNIYSEYRDSINAIYTDIFECIKAKNDFRNSADDRESYKLGEQQLREKLVQTAYAYSYKNANNWVGVYLLAQYFPRFTKKQNNAIIARMPQKFANTPAIKEIKQAVAKMK